MSQNVLIGGRPADCLVRCKDLRRSVRPCGFSRPCKSSRRSLPIVNFVSDAELKPNDVVILGAARTPVGNMFGILSSLSGAQLGGHAIKAAMERSGVPVDSVQELFLGHIASAGAGQSPGVQAQRLAGLHDNVPATTFNKACASGMKAIMVGAQSIKTGVNDCVVAGGMESMTNIPYMLPSKVRQGLRMGHEKVLDAMLSDGLWDPFNDVHMGSLADICAQKYGITREQSDHHASDSHARAQAAQQSGVLQWEVVAVNGNTKDEGPRLLEYDRIKKLRPVFTKEGGVVTVANASGISDGAAAVVLSSWSKAQEMGLEPLARILGYADAQQDPKWFTTSPALAIPKALKKAGIMDGKDVDYWEINEAFSAVDLANRKILGLADDRVNVHGGAVAYGHPVGCSGARILVSLLNVLRAKGGKIGCASICNGGGGASAVVVELNEKLHGTPDVPPVHTAKSS